MDSSSYLRSTECDPASGFTLIELLVTMTVAGILAAIAVPAFNNFIMNDRDANQINSLVMSFNYARSEAIKRNTTVGVTVCPSSDAMTCNSLNWSDGWLVLDQDINDTKPQLQAVPALAGVNALTVTLGGPTITFKSNGAVNGPMNIKVCDTRGSAYAHDVEVSPIGSISSSQTPGKNASGAALICP